MVVPILYVYLDEVVARLKHSQAVLQPLHGEGPRTHELVHPPLIDHQAVPTHINTVISRGFCQSARPS